MSNATAATTPKTNPAIDATALVVTANQATTTNPAVKGGPFKPFEANKDLITQNIPMQFLNVDYALREDLGDLKELSESIAREGLQEPLKVRQCKETAQLLVIDGVRRLNALKDLGWASAPCIIVEANQEQARHLAYINNKLRKNLSPIEEARHLRYMIDTFGYTLEEMSIKGYGEKSTIASRLKLLDLSKKVQENILKGELTPEHGLHLVKLPSDGEQERFAKLIIDMGLTAKRAEKKIDRYLEKGRNPKVSSQEPAANGCGHSIPGLFIKDASKMEELADKSIHLVVTSPPYFVGMEFEKGITFEQHMENAKNVLREIARVLHEGGVLALNLGDIRRFEGKRGKATEIYLRLMGHEYQRILQQNHVLLQDMIVWKKPIPWSDRKYLNYWEGTKHTAYHIADNFEQIFIFRKQGERVMPEDTTPQITKDEWLESVNGVWEIPTVRHTSGHPCEWPEELPAQIIKMFSFPGERVLDPWLGSGTTMKVARDLKRIGFGYEREAKYLPMIVEKLGKAPKTGATAVQTKNNDAPISAPLEKFDSALDDVEAIDSDDDMISHLEVEEDMVHEKPVKAPTNETLEGNEIIEPCPESEMPAPIATTQIQPDAAGMAG